ncbi:hypothetical protein PBCVCVG1_329R [Paramecium bursaria Chlorella virus CVG-1]|nr:hypothetical protein PBCVCVG1_329R [Paramecium bursaria Chlorella virus CVG-1]
MDANSNWNDVCALYNSTRDGGVSHTEAIKVVRGKFRGLGPANQKRLSDQYKPSSIIPKAGENWKDVCTLYNSLRNKGETHANAIKIVSSKYSGVGPGNQSRLERQYKPSTPNPPTPKPPTPEPEDVISTLDLNLLTKGGGDWKIGNAVNMKNSKVEQFQGDTVVKAVYGKNSGTSGDPGVGGFRFSAAPIGLNKDAITFAWEVYYPQGFQFAKGGKHGGTFIGHGAASGYNHSPTGSSNRIMWKKDGGVIDYIYPPSDLKQKIPGLVPDGHGIGFFQDDFEKALKYDMWNKVEIGTKMNTFKNGVPQLDGESYVVVNGKKRVLKGINWSRSPDLFINRFDWNNFFGGPDPSPVNQMCFFKNYQMKKYNA